MNTVKKLTTLNGTQKSAEIKDKIITFLHKHSYCKNTKQFIDIVNNCGIGTYNYNEVYYYRDCFGDVRGISIKSIVDGIIRRYSIVDDRYYIPLEHTFDAVYCAEHAVDNKVE